MPSRHTRPAAPGRAPSPRLIESLFGGTCVCSKTITKGDQIWYDPLTKKTACYTCGRSAQTNAQQGLSSIQEVDEIQSVIDRIGALQCLPKKSANAEAEITTLVKRLKAMAKTNKNALKYLRRGREGNAFTVRYTGVCRECRNVVEKGETAIYINKAIVCSKCAVNEAEQNTSSGEFRSGT